MMDMRYRHSLLFLAATLVLSSAAAQDKHRGNEVDSGSFGIMVKGTRVATETFRIEQRGDSSVVISELKSEDGGAAAQTAELEMSANGILKKYTWKEVKPSSAAIEVEPSGEQFLTVKTTVDTATPPKVSTMALAPATSIIDDNFFSQMQVLAWKYMASGCHPTPNGQNECFWGPAKLPILNPHQQEPLLVMMEFMGQQKIKMKGTEETFKTFKLKGEAGEWTLWFNAENKLVRVVITAENTEVLRD